MDSPCLSAAGLRCLDRPVPLAGSAFIAVGLPAYRPPPDSLGVATLRARAATGVGAASTPGPRCPRRSAMWGAVLYARWDSPCTLIWPRATVFVNHHSGGWGMSEPRQQFTCVHPSGLSLARFASMVEAPLRLFPQHFIHGGGHGSGH